MNTKAKIKVIKKGTAVKVAEPLPIEKKSTKETAREMVSTVTTWVSDFKQKRSEETKLAFEKLLANRPQTNGV